MKIAYLFYDIFSRKTSVDCLLYMQEQIKKKWCTPKTQSREPQSQKWKNNASNSHHHNECVYS